MENKPERHIGPRERFDACMQLAVFWSGRHDGRRQYEWKVMLAVWALELWAVMYLKRDWLPMLVVPLAVVGYVFLWIRAIWVANENDKRMARHFEFQAEAILSNPDHMLRPRPDWVRGSQKYVGFLRDWAMLFQIIVSVFLAALVYLLPQLSRLSAP